MTASIEEALAEATPADRASLLHVIEIARRIAPDAVDGTSYGMPALKVDGRPLIGVAASAKHLSVLPFSPAVVEAVADQLGDYSLSKGTIRFTADHPLPDDVIETIVRTRLAELS
ncbi:iron chaperone [Plantibacter sp. YIM 135249]|uniref:iron chaperone n=1 Tax=Plantibacter sp. YIM 135249 TaxID=3423918 RepID=UPI003D34F7E7